MGRRELKRFLRYPLCDKKQIELRLDAVSLFNRSQKELEALRAVLKELRDLERLTAKLTADNFSPSDLFELRTILQLIPSIKKILQALITTATVFDPSLLIQIDVDLSSNEMLLHTLFSALVDSDGSFSSFKGGACIRANYHAELDSLRAVSQKAATSLLEMEARERAGTGISSLKIRYNKVFGYSIEITKTHLAKVPAHYQRKQTLSTGERYVTAELKELEEKLLYAEEHTKVLEEKLLQYLKDEVKLHALSFLMSARALAKLDVMQSFSWIASQNRYIRPQINDSDKGDGWDLLIEKGRHPIVERIVAQGAFVPNSIQFSPLSSTWILTGPNMAGKSTVMRQVGLIVLMAHVGSFVPAEKAIIPLTDGIFTRIGSADDLYHGNSTFMVEMLEMNEILRGATHQSLILIDEIGRGTSTYDGLSLAWALLEHLHENIRAKTIFATHFHEITAIEKQWVGIKNANVQVEHWGEKMVFLHQLASGASPKSYGVEVAKLAGLPKPVLERAKSILLALESPGAQRG